MCVYSHVFPIQSTRCARKKHHHSYKRKVSDYPIKGQRRKKITKTHPYNEAGVSTNHNKYKLKLSF